MLTQYAFSILFIDKKKAKFSNDRFGFILYKHTKPYFFRINYKKLFSALALAITANLVVLAQGHKGTAWLSNAVFYQIYPSSYMATDGTGICDLQGLTSKLHYLKYIGVNTIWLPLHPIHI